MNFASSSTSLGPLFKVSQVMEERGAEQAPEEDGKVLRHLQSFHLGQAGVELGLILRGLSSTREEARRFKLGKTSEIFNQSSPIAIP